ncbi:MAG: GNAT family N-acetyltransferase [Anaerolineales bacterium]
MHAKIIEVGPKQLVDYETIPIKLDVKERLEVELVEGGMGGMRLHQVEVESPYVKDYDSYGDVPSDWPKKFDVSNLGFFLAMVGDRMAGGAVVASRTNEIIMLEEGKDLAVLWDLRVNPVFRGVGIPLFKYAAEWSRKRGCRRMKVETQNVNVPACRFYQRMGCSLGEIRRFGYAGIPAVAEEVMLNWYLDL